MLEAIVEHFGTDILDEKGELDRERLAEIVFRRKKNYPCSMALSILR